MKRVLEPVILSLLLTVPAWPATVDAYQDMESGNPGDILTTQPQASGHGSGGTWDVVGHTMTVSTNHLFPLRGAVRVDETFYTGITDTRSWMTEDDTQRQYV